MTSILIAAACYFLLIITIFQFMGLWERETTEETVIAIGVVIASYFVAAGFGILVEAARRRIEK